MRLYAILVYLLILNLVFGFVATAITGTDDQDGIFLPDAEGVVTLPTVDSFQDSLTAMRTALDNLSNATSENNWILSTLAVGGVVWQSGNVAWTFLVSVYTSAPAFIYDIIGGNSLIDENTYESFRWILTGGLILLTIYSAIQIISGKWFSFVE